MFNGRLRVKYKDKNPPPQIPTHASDILVGHGAIDLNNAHDFLIRIGFNKFISCDYNSPGSPALMYPFLSTTTAQVVHLHKDTAVVQKDNIKVVVSTRKLRKSKKV